MADENKTIVFGVRVDTTDLVNKQNQIASSIKQIQAEQLNLDGSTKENRKQFQENAAQLSLLQKQQALVTKQLGALTDAEKANTDTTEFNNNSIKQNRELLKQLNAEYIGLSKPTKEQTANIKRLSDTLKEQEAAIGNNTRNVGNYREAFQGVLQSLPGLRGGLEGVTNGFKAISLANPFTALVLILPPIITYLQKFESVFDAIERVVGGVQGAITGIVANFTKLLTLDISGFAEGVGEAASASYQLVAATQDLEDAERELGIQIAENEAKVKNLIIQSKDRTKTEAQRLALLDEASVIERKAYEQSLSLAKEQARIEAENLKKAEAAGTANDALRQREADARKALIVIASQSADVQEKIENRRNALIDERVAKQERATAKEKELLDKKAADEAKAIADQQKRIEDAAKKLEETTQAEFQFTQEATKLFYDQQNELLRQKFANDEITEEEYNSLATQLKIEQLETEKTIIADYSSQVENLELALAQKQLEIDKTVTENKLNNSKKVADNNKKNAEKIAKDNERLANQTNAIVLASSDILAQTLMQEGDLVKNFAKGAALAIVDVLEKQITVSIIAQSLATPSSVATFGAAGIARSAIILGLVKGAFAAFKAGIAGLSSKGSFAEGGYTGNGGKYEPAGIVHKGEYVVPKRLVPRFAPMLGAIESARVGGYANGGFVSETISREANESANLIGAVQAQQIVVSVQEITDVQNRLKAIESLTNI